MAVYDAPEPWGPWTTVSLPNPDRLFCGIQIAAHSMLDEGIDCCLDLLGEHAAVNAALLNAFSYYGAMGRPKAVQGDHGRPQRDNSKRKLTPIWVTPHEQYYKATTLCHKPADPSREYTGREAFTELAEPYRKRGMKLYVRWYEPANDFIPVENWKTVLYEDAEGKRGKRPCWNNPDYRAFVAATMQDLFESYALDGLQCSVERMTPLTDPDSDAMTIRWEISPEVPKGGYAGMGEHRATQLPDLIRETRNDEITFTASQKEGAYRVFVYALDGQGNAATANIPFFVKP